MPKKPGRNGVILEDRKKQKGDYTFKMPADQVEALTSIQCTDEEIAAFFGCTKQTIEMRKKQDSVFLAAYQNGKAKGRVSLRRQLFKSCEDGNVSAQIWMSKQILGMRDVTALEHSGPHGQPIEVVNNADLKGATTDELLAMKKIWADIKRRRNVESGE